MCDLAWRVARGQGLMPQLQFWLSSSVVAETRSQEPATSSHRPPAATGHQPDQLILSVIDLCPACTALGYWLPVRGPQ